MVDGPGGFKLIGGASGLARMADLSDFDRQRLVTALAELEARNDIILIDTGAGISPNVLSFTRCADQVLVVTTPEPTAITDAYAVIKVISRDAPDRPLSLLVNQVRVQGEGQLVYDRIAKVARQFLSVHVLDAGFVPPTPKSPRPFAGAPRFYWPARTVPPADTSANSPMRLERGVAPTVDLAGGGFFNRMSRWFRR